MKRLAAAGALALASGTAALLALSAAAGPAGAATSVEPVPWGGQGSAEQCLVTHADNSQGACLEVSAAGMMTTDGKTVLGRGAVRLLGDVVDADKVARIQIDQVVLGTLNAAVALSPTVNSGDGPKSVQADTGHVPWWTRNCAQRYHVRVNYSARMTDGSLKQGSFFGPWFDTAYSPCAGFDYGVPNSGTKCLVTHADHSQGACIDARVSGAISHDRTRAFARGTLAVEEWVVDADRIASIQIDRVVLKLLSSSPTVLQTSPTVNNGGHIPWAIAAQTVNGQRWAQDAGNPRQNCAVSYQAVMFFSARLTDGQLATGRIATQPFKAPDC